jgi:hypothetical protein
MKTRNNREIIIKIAETKNLSEIDRTQLAQTLHALAVRNTATITVEYLLKRVNNYGIISFAYNKETLVGFGFADERLMPLGPFKIPLVHFGLMIIDTDWRGERVSRIVSRSIVKHIVKKNPWRSLMGFAVSAKCSSPVSFYRLQQASLRLGWPRFTKQGELDRLSKLAPCRKLSKSVTLALGLPQVEDFIISGVNEDSGFKLAAENYHTNCSYEEKVLSFFEKHVIPNNELLFVTYGHPLMVAL